MDPQIFLIMLKFNIKVLQPEKLANNEELKNIREDVIRIDKNECKNYLTEFLEDMKKGIDSKRGSGYRRSSGSY